MTAYDVDMATIELQREHALRLADRIRCGRSKLLQRVRQNLLDVPGLLNGDYDLYAIELAATDGHRELGTVHVSELLERMNVTTLLLAHPGVGRARARSALMALGVQPWHTDALKLNQLSPARRRQLAGIVEQLGGAR